PRLWFVAGFVSLSCSFLFARPLPLYPLSFSLYPLAFTLYPLPFSLYPLPLTPYPLAFTLTPLPFGPTEIQISHSKFQIANSRTWHGLLVIRHLALVTDFRARLARHSSLVTRH